MYIGDLPACLSVRYVWEVPLEVDSLGLALHIVRNLRVDAGETTQGPLEWGHLMTLPVWRSVHRARSTEAGFPPCKWQRMHQPGALPL